MVKNFSLKKSWEKIKNNFQVWSKTNGLRDLHTAVDDL